MNARLWDVTVKMRDEDPRARKIWVHTYAVLALTEEFAKARARREATCKLPTYDALVISVEAEISASPIISTGTRREARAKKEKA